MKSMLLLGAFFCSVGLFAQDCNTYYFLQNNKTIEMAILNKKGEQSAKQVYTVSNVNSAGSAATADLETEMFDKKGKSMAKGKAKIKCDGGVMMVDMKMSMPQQQGMPNAGESDVKAENMYMEYPTNMNVGDNLKNASMHLDMDNNGMKQSVDMDVFDRKVEAKEKVTTPAGSWDCYKISYKSKMKIKTMGIGMPMNVEGVEYFAPGFGIVKTQSKNGGTEIISIK
jgi:hypothetical protein